MIHAKTVYDMQKKNNEDKNVLCKNNITIAKSNDNINDNSLATDTSPDRQEVREQREAL